MDLSDILRISAILIVAHLSRGNAATELNYTIKTDWNNNMTVPENEFIQLTFTGIRSDNGGRAIEIEIKAPFYDDPAPPGGSGRFDGLWDYEVVEVFFLGEDDKYVELEFGPHQHYLVYQLEGERNAVNTTQQLEVYQASINRAESVWSGKARVTQDQLPIGVNAFNAYAIYGEGEDRVYMALFPNEDENATGPDFHKLETFKPIDLSGLLTGGAFSSLFTNHFLHFIPGFTLANKILA